MGRLSTAFLILPSCGNIHAFMPNDNHTLYFFQSVVNWICFKVYKITGLGAHDLTGSDGAGFQCLPGRAILTRQGKPMTGKKTLFADGGTGEKVFRCFVYRYHAKLRIKYHDGVRYSMKYVVEDFSGIARFLTAFHRFPWI